MPFTSASRPEDINLSEHAGAAKSDGMRRPVSERDAVGPQVIDVLEAQEIKETGNEEGWHRGGEGVQEVS